jgi:HSP20 family molecular chaperone IbpA
MTAVFIVKGRGKNMKKDDRKTNETETDDSIVESVVNDLLPGMGNLVKNLRKRSPELDRKIRENDQEIKKRLEEGYSPEPKITYRIKTRTLVPDAPKKAEERPENKTIEPITDIFKEGDQLRVVVEMPGVDRGKIHVAVKGRSLVISAKDGDKRYKKEVTLPWQGKVAKERYQNGILDLVLEQHDD